MCGFCFCITSIKTIETIGPHVYFPAFAGEDDFSLRFKFFLFGLLPAFLLIGSWIGHSFYYSIKIGALKFTGIVIGTIVHVFLLWMLKDLIASLPNREFSNTAVFLSFFSWISLVVIMALICSHNFSLKKFFWISGNNHNRICL